MTRKELLQTIEDIENGLAMNPTGEILERLTNRLERVKNQLFQFDQKKSEAEQQIQKPDHEPTTPKEKEAKRFDEYMEEKIEREAINQRRDQKDERQQPRTVNEVANILEYGASFAAPTPYEPIFTLTERKQVKGEKSVAIKVTRTLSDLRQKMRQNFTNVYTSVEFQERKGDLMKMIAFCNLIVQHAMLNEYYEATGGVTMGDLLSGYRYKSAEQKQRAHMLLVGVLSCQKALIEDNLTTPEKLSQIAKDAIWG